MKYSSGDKWPVKKILPIIEIGQTGIESVDSFLSTRNIIKIFQLILSLFHNDFTGKIYIDPTTLHCLGA